MNNILVVDDEENVRNLLQGLLDRNWYEVKTADNGLDSFSMLNNNNVDIVLLDLMLPDVNGKEVLKEIKKRHSSVEVIVISGYGTFKDVVNSIKEGAYDFIEKPFENARLLSTISKALRQRELNLKFKYLDEQYNNIKKLKEYNENILDHIPVGILTVNNEDIINACNLKVEKMLKLKIGRNREMNIFDVLKNVFNEYNKIESLYKGLKNKNKEFNTLFLNNTIDSCKERYHFRVSGYKFSEGILLFVTDITEEYNIKQQLIHSEKMSTIGQFISSITHGLGNNMANIIANASGIVDETGDSSRYLNQLIPDINSDRKNKKPNEVKDKIITSYNRLNDYCARLIKRTNEMNNNIKSLLNYSRNIYEDNSKSKVNINTIIEEALNIIKNHKYEDIEFVVKPGKNIPLISINSYQIRDLIIDLALNGIQAMDGKGKLILTTEFVDEKECVKICISDTGKGIPVEISDKIFGAFFTTKKNGTGLGLVNVKTAIKNNHGEISFKTKPGKGTTFYVELPLKG